MLGYRHLRHPVFTNMMLSNTYLQRNNKCLQVFASDFGWVQVYPMKTKGKKHKSLSLMFLSEGVPLSMVNDGSKEQSLGKFCWKLMDAHCQLRQTEPCSAHKKHYTSSCFSVPGSPDNWYSPERLLFTTCLTGDR